MSEVIVYHVYNKQKKIHKSPTPLRHEPGYYSKHKRSGVEKFLFRISRILLISGLVLVVYSYGPSVFFWVQGNFGTVVSNFKLSSTEVNHLEVSTKTAKVVYEPPFDAKLPKTNRLTIPKIGVDTDIQEATYDNYQAALEKGVWRVSNFGAPNEHGVPVILAAHRYGYLAWTNLFRHKNSFFNLPSVKKGDIVQIVWRQRKYTYEIYNVEEGKEITDYSADLILYTCVQLSGPDRIFVYARLISY